MPHEKSSLKISTQLIGNKSNTDFQPTKTQCELAKIQYLCDVSIFCISLHSIPALMSINSWQASQCELAQRQKLGLLPQVGLGAVGLPPKIFIWAWIDRGKFLLPEFDEVFFNKNLYFNLLAISVTLYYQTQSHGKR